MYVKNLTEIRFAKRKWLNIVHFDLNELERKVASADSPFKLFKRMCLNKCSNNIHCNCVNMVENLKTDLQYIEKQNLLLSLLILFNPTGKNVLSLVPQLVV